MTLKAVTGLLKSFPAQPCCCCSPSSKAIAVFLYKEQNVFFSGLAKDNTVLSLGLAIKTGEGGGGEGCATNEKRTFSFHLKICSR